MADFDEHVFQSILKIIKSPFILSRKHTHTQGQYPRHNKTINEQSRRRERRKSLQGAPFFDFSKKIKSANALKMQNI